MSTIRVFSVVSFLLLPFASMANPMDSNDVDLLAFNDDEDFGDASTLSRGKAAGDSASSKKKKQSTETKPSFDFDEPEEEFDLLDDATDSEPMELLGNFEGLEDEPIESFDRPDTKRVSSPSALIGPISLDVAGKSPLADNYALTVTAIDRDAVVVELPVLVAKSRVAVESGFQIVAEVFTEDIKVAEVRQVVNKESLAEFGPSFVFLKVLAPVIENQGEIKIVVQKTDVDGTNATALFQRSTPYALR